MPPTGVDHVGSGGTLQATHGQENGVRLQLRQRLAASTFALAYGLERPGFKSPQTVMMQRACAAGASPGGDGLSSRKAGIASRTSPCKEPA